MKLSSVLRRPGPVGFEEGILMGVLKKESLVCRLEDEEVTLNVNVVGSSAVLMS